MPPLISSVTCNSPILNLLPISPSPKPPSLVSNLGGARRRAARAEARSDGLETQETSAQQETQESENVSSNDGGGSKATPFPSSVPLTEKDIKKVRSFSLLPLSWLHLETPKWWSWIIPLYFMIIWWMVTNGFCVFCYQNSAFIEFRYSEEIC